MYQSFPRLQENETLVDSGYGSSQNSHSSGQVPQPQPMHRAPTAPSRKRENAKKYRTCGKQVFSIITTWFRSTEQQAHQKPLPRVPMHEISALFALPPTHEAIPGSQNPRAIPIVPLHEISPLFPRRIKHGADHMQRSQGEYSTPQTGDRLLMPQNPSVAKVFPPRRPVANVHDSLFVRAKHVDLGPVSGGEAEEYYRSFKPASIKQHGDVKDNPVAEPDRQQRPYSSDPSFPASPDMPQESGWHKDVRDMIRRGQVHPDVLQPYQSPPIKQRSEAKKIPMVKSCTQRRPLSISSASSEATVESDWRADQQREDAAAPMRRGKVHPAVHVKAAARESMAAELCCVSDSEHDADNEDSLCEPPRRDSFSLYEASSSAQSEVSDPDVQEEWSAIMMHGKHQACLTRFVHHWKHPNAEPIDQSLFAGFDGDHTQGVEEQSPAELRNNCGTLQPAGDDSVTRDFPLAVGELGLFELSADGAISRPVDDKWVPRPNITRFDSLPTVDRLREAFLKRNAEHPDTESARGMQPEVLFQDFYKFRTGRSF